MALGGLADAVSEEVLGEEVAGHGERTSWVQGSIACLGGGVGVVGGRGRFETRPLRKRGSAVRRGTGTGSRLKTPG